jgi:flagellar biogenesis protein FliO
MKNSLTPIIFGHQIPARYGWVRPCLQLQFALLLILAPILLVRAQKPDALITVSSVSSHPTQNGTVVAVTADSSLSRAQTWQDKEGFHVVVPDAGLSDLVKSSKGVRVRRVGSAIEILVLTKQGTPVGVQTYDNNLQLTIDGKLDASRPDGDSAVSQDQSSGQSAGTTDYSAQSYSNSGASYSTGSSYPAETTSTAAQQSSAQATPTQDSPGQVRDAGEYQSQEEGNVVDTETQDQGVLASVFSGTSVLIVLVLAVVALLVIRKFRSKATVTTKDSVSRAPEESSRENEQKDFGAPGVDPRESGAALARANRAVPANGSSRERKERRRCQRSAFC